MPVAMAFVPWLDSFDFVKDSCAKSMSIIVDTKEHRYTKYDNMELRTHFNTYCS